MMTYLETLFNNYPLNTDEKDLLINLIDEFSKDCQDQSWINELNYRSIDFKWSDCLFESAILGIKYSFGNSIYLQNNHKQGEQTNQPLEFWIPLIAPVVIHELRHIWQKKHRCLKYLLYTMISHLPGMYKSVPTEKDAWKIQEIAENFFNNSSKLARVKLSRKTTA